MKVLLCLRQNYYKNFASDSMQALKIMKYMREKGITVDIDSSNVVDYSNYDIVHLFNLLNTGESYKHFRQALREKCNIVVTPNYWNYERYFNYKNDSEAIKLWRRCKPYREEILKRSKGIFCSSMKEKELLRKDFIIPNRYNIIQLGVEVQNEDIPLYSFKERHNLEKYVLCVGRIKESKNQLLLSKVCEELKVHLVLIGNIDDKAYFRECMKHKNVKYFGFMDSYNIYNAYRFAQVHALVGFSEMPGLSSIEAGAIGCNIVTTEEGCSREYFDDMAIYCDPYNEESIYNAVKKGLTLRKNRKLKKHIMENYSWKKYVDRIYDEYLRISP